MEDQNLKSAAQTLIGILEGKQLTAAEYQLLNQARNLVRGQANQARVGVIRTGSARVGQNINTQNR